MSTRALGPSALTRGVTLADFAIIPPAVRLYLTRDSYRDWQRKSRSAGIQHRVERTARRTRCAHSAVSTRGSCQSICQISGAWIGKDKPSEWCHQPAPPKKTEAAAAQTCDVYHDAERIVSAHEHAAGTFVC